MTRLQKIWMWIFIAMFAVPEILWSPVANFLYTFWKGGNIPSILRDNFLISSDYRKLAIIVIFIQGIGALLSSVLIFRSSIKNIYKVILFVSFFIFFLLSVIVASILLLTLNMELVM